MTVETEDIATLLDQANALLFWWGIPNSSRNDDINGQMRRFQVIGSDLQSAYSDAYRRQIEATLTANERLALSFQDFLNSYHMHEIIAVESSALAIVLDGVAAQARTWNELTQTVQDCCGAWRHEGTAEIEGQAMQETEIKPVFRPAPRLKREATRHLEQV